MRIYKETNIKNPFHITTLDNGVILFVYDGYAEGTDGRVYKPVVEDRGEGECEVIGWCEMQQVNVEMFPGSNLGG